MTASSSIVGNRGHIPHARTSAALAALLSTLAASAALAGVAPFDLAGPDLQVTVGRGQETLPIAEVPNLAVGDRLWVRADLPPHAVAALPARHCLPARRHESAATRLVSRLPDLEALLLAERPQAHGARRRRAGPGIPCAAGDRRREDIDRRRAGAPRRVRAHLPGPQPGDARQLAARRLSQSGACPR